jgi:hypothetical protein
MSTQGSKSQIEGQQHTIICYPKVVICCRCHNMIFGQSGLWVTANGVADVGCCKWDRELLFNPRSASLSSYSKK